jgi:beta-phosphoglucomutase
MPQAWIFDFDGVLADSESLHWRALDEVLAPDGCGITWADYQGVYIGFDDRDAIRHAFAERGKPLSAEGLADRIRRKGEAFACLAAAGELRAFPGAVEAVRAAAARGPIALCTGAVPGDITPFLTRVGLLPLFQAIVTAEDVARSKPDPESYALAVRRLGLAPADCLAIEDTPAGLVSARGAGCRTLGVAQTHAAADLEPFADRVIGSMTGFIP